MVIQWNIFHVRVVWLVNIHKVRAFHQEPLGSSKPSWEVLCESWTRSERTFKIVFYICCFLSCCWLRCKLKLRNKHNGNSYEFYLKLSESNHYRCSVLMSIMLNNLFKILRIFLALTHDLDSFLLHVVEDQQRTLRFSGYLIFWKYHIASELLQGIQGGN